MKLELYQSNTANGATARVIEAMGRRRDGKTRHVFLVPDRYTLSVEREIFERLGVQCLFDVEVTGFSRFAVRTLGRRAPRCLSKEGAVMLFRRAIAEELPRLNYYRRVSGTPDFAKEMFAVVAAMRNGGYTASAIAEAAQKLGNCSTARKLNDIAVLTAGYERLLTEEEVDSTGRLDRLIEALQSTDAFSDTCFYLVGFDRFSGKQLQIVTELLRVARCLSVAVVSGSGGYNAEFFPAETAVALEEIAARLDAEVKRFEFFEVLGAPFDGLHRALFSYTGKPCDRNSDALVLYEEPDVYAEWNAIAVEIGRLVTEEGLRYRDIAVVTLNPDDQALTSIFKRYEIPYYCDRPYRLADTVVSKYLVAAIDAVRTGWRRDNVFALVKNPVFGVSSADADAFENYCLKYRVDYKAFAEPFRRGTVPDGVEAVRARLAERLGRLAESKSDLGAFVRALRPFVEDCDPSMFEGDDPVEEVNRRAPGALLSILDETERLAGKVEGTFAEHGALLNAAIASVTISVLPQGPDTVFVGILRESRLSGIKALFVTGAAEGYCPSIDSYRAIVSAGDADLMAASGVRLYPLPDDRYRENVFHILELLTKAKRMYLGYARVGLSGEAQTPSAAFHEACRLTRSEPVRLTAVDPPPAALVAKRNAHFLYLSLCARVKEPDITRSELQTLADLEATFGFRPPEGERERTLEGDRLTLFFGKDRTTSVSQLECYFACPLRHFWQYGLGLKEREEGELQPADFGIILHRALELYFKATLQSLRSMPEEERRREAERAVRQAIAEAGESYDAFRLNAVRAVEREGAELLKALSDNVDRSAYTPTMIEAWFGKGGALEPVVLRAGDQSFTVRGKIDRVDCDGRDAAVIDYKTGSTAKIADLGKVYSGQKIQSYLYLAALQAAGYRPSGALYLSVSDTRKEGETPYAMVGQIGQGLQAIERYERGFADRYDADGKAESRILKLKLKKLKDGRDKLSGEIDALDDAGFAYLTEYVRKVSEQAIAEIAAGEIGAMPTENGCQSCRYRTICAREATPRKKPDARGFVARVSMQTKEGEQDNG